RAGGWSGSPSPGSTSRPPTCASVSVRDARSTVSFPPPSCAPSARAASTLTADDASRDRRLTSVSPVSDAYRRAGIAAHAAADKNGEDVVVLDVGDIISIAETFVLVSASNTRLVRTIVDEIELALKLSDDEGPRSVEGL